MKQSGAMHLTEIGDVFHDIEIENQTSSMSVSGSAERKEAR